MSCNPKASIVLINPFSKRVLWSVVFPQASIVRSKKDTIHTKAERHILEAVKVC